VWLAEDQSRRLMAAAVSPIELMGARFTGTRAWFSCSLAGALGWRKQMKELGHMAALRTF
jgi:hypothetical protein